MLTTGIIPVSPALRSESLQSQKEVSMHADVQRFHTYIAKRIKSMATQHNQAMGIEDDLWLILRTLYNHLVNSVQNNAIPANISTSRQKLAAFKRLLKDYIKLSDPSAGGRTIEITNPHLKAHIRREIIKILKPAQRRSSVQINIDTTDAQFAKILKRHLARYAPPIKSEEREMLSAVGLEIADYRGVCRSLSLGIQVFSWRDLKKPLFIVQATIPAAA